MSSAVKKENSSTKKSKLHPRDWDSKDLSSSKKLKTGQVSKSKMSTQKKCEVTFSDSVVEIKENTLPVDNKGNMEEAKILNEPSTPMKHSTPDSHVYKSVKEHVKTPFSKVKDNSCNPTPRLEGSNLAKKFSDNDAKLNSNSKTVTGLNFDMENRVEVSTENEKISEDTNTLAEDHKDSKEHSQIKTTDEVKEESEESVQIETAAKIEDIPKELEQGDQSTPELIDNKELKEGTKNEEEAPSQTCLSQKEEN